MNNNQTRKHIVATNTRIVRQITKTHNNNKRTQKHPTQQQTSQSNTHEEIAQT